MSDKKIVVHGQERVAVGTLRGTLTRSEDQAMPMPADPAQRIAREQILAEARAKEQALVEQHLRDRFPHGHPEFIPLTVDEMKLHSEKNYDYAAGGDPLGNFKRVSTILGQYPGLDLGDPAVVAMVYALKQVDAYFWLKCQNRDGKVEGKAARLGDVSVYAKLAVIIEREAEEGKGNQ